MAELQQFSLTFGLRYGDEEHPTFAKANPRGWVTVLAPGYEAARSLVNKKIGNNWAFLYPAGEFRATRYPAGEIERWSTDEPVAPPRASPDLIDPLVNLPGSYAQLTELILAALAIHRPCHTAKTEPFGCEHGAHYGDHDLAGVFSGVPTASQPGECMTCSYDDRIVTYPCPTAQALGVTA